MTESLTPEHRKILVALHERTDERMPEPGRLTNSATCWDPHEVYVHWRTAQFLHRRGLVHYPFIDPDICTVALTDAGRAAIEVTP